MKWRLFNGALAVPPPMANADR
jgi:hypothetical protein